jgi:hypothetical protein
MGAILITFLMLWLGSGYLGVKLLVASLRTRLEPLIPLARVIGASGAELAYQHATDAAAHGARSFARIAAVAIGLFMILWPMAVVSWFLTTSHGLGSL